MTKKLYEILNIDDENVSQEAIRKAYRKLALKYHPDKNKSHDAQAKFEAVNSAYVILGDPIKRSRYDAGLIDDQGQEVAYAPPSPSPSPSTSTFSPRRTNHAHFFKSKPSYYIFIQENDDLDYGFTSAYSNQPKSTFVYKTLHSLNALFNLIQQEVKDLHSADGHFTYHRESAFAPAHILVSTFNVGLAEMLIDKLLTQTLLELVQPNQNATEIFSTRPF